jgi:hypothetical protein
MTGGIVQLVAYGKEDLFLTRDPQITFFKVIYRRHTNFAREEIPQFFIYDPNFGKRTSCIVSPEGDLINRMALKITLPEIPKFTSSKSVTNLNGIIDSTGTGVSNDNTATKFAWIRRIGYAMIKYIEIEINGIVIDRHYGEWLHIWSILTTKNIKDDGLNKLIGNVPELTEFTDSKDEYIMYIPLQFWFCRASGLSLPLISLQFSDIKVNLEFQNIENCLIASPTHYIKCAGDLVNFAPNEYLYQKGSDGVDRYGIYSHFDVVNKRLYYTSVNPDKFTGIPYDGDSTLLDDATKASIISTPRSEKYAIKGVSTDFSIKPELNVRSVTTHKRSLKNINLKECVLLTDYVYLDDDERMKFAQTKHDYLIEQLYFTPDLPIEGTNPKVRLNIDQPCKLTVWVTQLDYISGFNDRFNYTDSHVLKRYYDVNYTDPTKLKTYSNVDVNEEVGNSLIDEETVRLNSQVRLSQRANEYYQYIQPFQHADNTLPNGCGMYSYCIVPTDPGPSGTTNMSQIELIELNLKLNYRVNVNQKAKFRSYSLAYNVWRVENGLCAPIFVR